MDIRNRKTTLDDNAEIYNRSTDKVTKNDLKNLTGRQKIAYFNDYYLAGLLVAIVVAVIIVYLVYTTIINPSRDVLNVIFLSGSYIEDQEGLADELEAYIGMERKKDYVNVAYYNLEDYQMNMAYVTLVGAGEADIIICPYSVFENEARLGMLADLSQFLPPDLYAELEGRIVTGKTEETDAEGNVISVGEETPFGVDISDNPLCRKYVTTAEKTILCLFAAPRHEENTRKALDLLLPQS